ncbi:MAG: hypothetical protein RLZZ422_748 [Pseudomonadota bacterium]|jgi:hypothetical protein
MPRNYLSVFSGCLLLSTLIACQDNQTSPSVKITPAKPQHITELPLPSLDNKPYVTDKITLPNGAVGYLWQDQQQCVFQLNQQDKQPLQIPAPCRFVRSPGTDTIQVFQADRTTRIMGVIGHIQANNCGDTARGIINKGGKLTLAPSTLSQSTFCVTKGLDNAQYMLFLKP